MAINVSECLRVYLWTVVVVFVCILLQLPAPAPAFWVDFKRRAPISPMSERIGANWFIAEISSDTQLSPRSGQTSQRNKEIKIGRRNEALIRTERNCRLNGQKICENRFCFLSRPAVQSNPNGSSREKKKKTPGTIERIRARIYAIVCMVATVAYGGTEWRGEAWK